MVSENSRIYSTSLNNPSLEGPTSSSIVGQDGCGNVCSNISLENPVVGLSEAVVIQQQNTRHRFATLSCISGSNVNNDEDREFNNDNNNQFIVNRQRQQQHRQEEEVGEQLQRRRPFLCRTPPPNYHSLPSTPPPSYTQHPSHSQHFHLPTVSYQQQPTLRIQENVSRDIQDNVNNVEQQQEQQSVEQQQPSNNHQQHYPQQQLQPLRFFQVPETLAQHSALNRLNAASNGSSRNESVLLNRQQQVVGLANERCTSRNVATVSQNHQQQQQQQQIQQRRRKQRRRNLNLLQQQHHQNSLSFGNLNTDSDSSTSLSDGSESDNDIICVGSTRDQRRRRRQRLLKLRGKLKKIFNISYEISITCKLVKMLFRNVF